LILELGSSKKKFTAWWCLQKNFKTRGGKKF